MIYIIGNLFEKREGETETHFPHPLVYFSNGQNIQGSRSPMWEVNWYPYDTHVPHAEA